MRGQDITPWETHYVPGAKTQREERSESIIDIKLPRIKLSHRLPEIVKDYSTPRRLTCKRRNLLKNNKIDEILNDVGQFRKHTSLLKEKQQSLADLINQLPLIALIKQEIRKQHSQLNFMELLKKQAEERTNRNIQAEEVMERLPAKDRPNFTRQIEKNITLVNASLQSAGQLRLSKKQQEAELIKQLLKKEINLLISNRMKIVGKTKNTE